MIVGDKKMNHTLYPKTLCLQSATSLLFIIKDAKEAIAANPDNPNNGYYADEIHYCAAELRRRETRGCRPPG